LVLAGRGCVCAPCRPACCFFRSFPHRPCAFRRSLVTGRCRLGELRRLSIQSWAGWRARALGRRVGFGRVWILQVLSSRTSLSLLLLLSLLPSNERPHNRPNHSIDTHTTHHALRPAFSPPLVHACPEARRGDDDVSHDEPSGGSPLSLSRARARARRIAAAAAAARPRSADHQTAEFPSPATPSQTHHGNKNTRPPSPPPRAPARRQRRLPSLARLRRSPRAPSPRAAPAASEPSPPRPSRTSSSSARRGAPLRRPPRPSSAPLRQTPPPPAPPPPRRPRPPPPPPAARRPTSTRPRSTA